MEIFYMTYDQIVQTMTVLHYTTLHNTTTHNVTNTKTNQNRKKTDCNYRVEYYTLYHIKGSS